LARKGGVVKDIRGGVATQSPVIKKTAQKKEKSPKEKQRAEPLNWEKERHNKRR